MQDLLVICMHSSLAAQSEAVQEYNISENLLYNMLVNVSLYIRIPTLCS